MGNHQQHQEIQRKINELYVVKKNSHYAILKAPNGKEYIKFLYTPILDDKQTHQSTRHKTNSIFNHKYLLYRYECQNNQNKMNTLPQILAFGQQPQNSSIISCTGNKLNFVIFQHPVKTLKQQIQTRITSGQPFKESEYLHLIKSVIQSLSQYYEHIKSWNQEILERKTFSINEQNIYVASQGQFIVSDILSHFNEIENLSKQQVTLKKSSRANSLTNLHAKVTGKKLKQKYWETNVNNLLSIIEGIIFKFQCFSQPYKNSFQQSQSLSTALQSYRGLNKNSIAYSSQFEKMLKDLRHNNFNQETKIIQEVDRLLNAIHLPLPIEKSEDVSKLSERRNSVEKVLVSSESRQKLKLNGINSFVISQGRNPLGEIQNQNTNNIQQRQNKIQISSEFVQNRNYASSNSQSMEHKILQRQNTKIRLSLKKDSQVEKSLQKRQASVQQTQTLKRKNSHPKFLCSKTYQNQPKGKQNVQLSSKIMPDKVQQQRKICQILNAQLLTQKILNTKLADVIKDEKALQPQKKKIMLKKQPGYNNQNLTINENKITKKSEPESMVHLNPMSRKKTLGMNKLLNCKSKQKITVFKTHEKPNQMDVQFIQNLSSIISNQNNSMSSYGIPITDEFKTDNSLIQDEGCVGFNQNLEASPLKSVNFKTQPSDGSQSFKKQIHTLSPPCVKLSSYPSLELVESIIERPEDKIPQFLKQFKLPQKHLLALNNIILKQKDMIMQESFEQSEFNSIRHSVPNILALEEQINDLRKKRNSKNGLEHIQSMLKMEKSFKQLEGVVLQKQEHVKQSFIYDRDGDSIESDLKFIEISLANNIS